MPRGMTLISSVAALAVAATLSLVWINLWQQQQQLQRMQQWQHALLQLKQAQRAFFKQQQRFALNQDELLSAGLLPHRLSFPETAEWRFQPQQHVLLMQTEVALAAPRLLLGDAGSPPAYNWQPPTLTVKVIGYVN
ncbi:MAG: hypothetical protein COB75_05595 [Idiomarina sp.]|uniref:hypothetical protein n=1 Tax=Idiomarina sp. TaxID=1874361 RepID=UPI000C1180AB|nr:hypothetical protein [Idiomarina sp.]MBL4742374.1 hypothetical protein [Idiomarina sp.]PHQ76994.1 MAG: hypothetical protein COB75_05595 [Idiomarina sp.]